ncbi:MAG: type II secretion system protein M [Burkholderiales bacterium]|nr:type II secretion system protein M [Burkholderiales bacterium]
MTNETSSFDALRQQWQARWNALAPRDRQIAQAAAAVVLLVLVVFLGIRPAWRILQTAPAQLREVNTQLEQMRRMAEDSQTLRRMPPVPPAQAEAALKAATERLGEGAHLSVQGDRATVTLTKVSGAALVDWLGEARASARVRPLEANLNQVEPAHYSGTVVLGLAPGSAAAR